MQDTAAAGRARTRSLVRGLVTSLLGRGLALVTPLILIPVLYRYFGTVQYGLYATVVSLTSMFVWADLGLGNGLLTRLTAALTKNDLAGARELIAAAYSTLSGIAGLLVLGVVASPLIVPWAAVIGIDGAEQVGATVVTCFTLLFLNVPLSLIQRVQYAAQELALSNLYQLVAPAFVLVVALVGVWLELSYVPILIGISAGPLVASLAASFRFYSRRPDLRPRLVSPMSATGRSLLRLGVTFLFIQVASAVALNADVFMAAHIADADELADFTATTRFYLVLASLVSVTMLPLWPSNAEALARGDQQWVRKSTRTMALVALVVLAGVGVFMTVGGSAVLPPVLGGDYEVNRVLMVGLTLFWTLVGVASPFFMVQNSIGLLQMQFLAWPAYLILSVPAKWWVGSTHGIEWMPWTGAVLYACTVLVAALLGCRFALARDTASGGSTKNEES